MADRFYGDVVAGTTDVSIEVVLRSTADSSAVTAIAHTAVTAVYYRQGTVNPASITMSALASNDSTHTDGGWREVSASTYPGRYRLDVPDAAFAVGADWVGVQVRVSSAFNYDAQFRLRRDPTIDGVAAAGGTVTSIPTTSLVPPVTAADQFKGRVVIFHEDTTTAALRGQATDITANTPTGTLTVTSLTTPPVAGDTFLIV